MKWLPVLLVLFVVAASGRTDPAPVKLWPGTAPGETATLPPEADQNTAKDPLIAGRPIIRLGNVSVPTLTVFQPAAAKRNGAAVLVCPGGGYHILAYDLEGTEVCAWLNSLGMTAVLLKYRVPSREGLPRYTAAFQDAQRALGWTRAHAAELGIDPQRIGVLGFSAGGHLSALLSTDQGPRTYPKVDMADDVSCRPDFCVLVYPGYVALAENNFALAPELKVTAATPPTFLVMAEDDPAHVENVLVYFLALKNAHVPAELHVYPVGGHGYGLRRTKNLVTTWPDRVETWLDSAGFLTPKK